MKFRRIRFLIVTVFLIYGISLFTLRYYAAHEDLIPSSLKETDIDFGSLFSLFQGKDSYSFNLWTDKLFDRLIAERGDDDDFVRMAKLRVDPYIPEERDSIDIPKYVDSETDNPHMVPFDPRLTLGIILNDLNTQLTSVNTTEDLRLEVFHWSDWTDLTILHEQMLVAGSKRHTCSDFAENARPPLFKFKDYMDVSEFCVNDVDLGNIIQDMSPKDPMRAQLQSIQKSPYRLGFHITKFGGRVPKQDRILQSAAYLAEFMPPPLAIVMLLPSQNQNSTLLKMPVNGDLLARTKLVDSELARLVLRKTERLTLSKEVAGVQLRLNTKSAPKFVEFKHMNSDLFEDKLATYHGQLMGEAKLSPSLLNYRESLNLSLTTERPSKYFDEAKFVNSFKDWAKGNHYDWRFFKEILDEKEMMVPHLHALLLAWLRFVESAGLNSWVAHGSLLSWYWNGGIFPWDLDIDVQMPIDDLHRLSRDYNQTIIVDFGLDPNKEVRTGRFFLDSSTWISHRTSGEGLNNIDARFIDLDSGLYIDITGLAVSNTVAPARYDGLIPESLKRAASKVTKGGKLGSDIVPDEREIERNSEARLYNCRNNHFLSLRELSPLRLTYVEGIPARVPNKFTEILQTEYGEGSTTMQKFKKYAFFPRLSLWQPRKTFQKYTLKSKKPEPKLDLGEDLDLAVNQVDSVSVFHLNDRDYLELLAEEPEVLLQYIVSRNVTQFHKQEMVLLLEGRNTGKTIISKRGKLLWNFGDVFRDVNNIKAIKRKTDFNKQVEELQEQVNKFRSGESENQYGEKEIGDSPKEEKKAGDAISEPEDPPELMVEQTQEMADNADKARGQVSG